jgi:hypothetical protein
VSIIQHVPLRDAYRLQRRLERRRTLAASTILVCLVVCPGAQAAQTPGNQVALSLTQDSATGSLQLTVEGEAAVELVAAGGGTRGYDFATSVASLGGASQIPIVLKRPSCSLHGEIRNDSRGTHLIFDTTSGQLPQLGVLSTLIGRGLYGHVYFRSGTPLTVILEGQ